VPVDDLRRGMVLASPRAVRPTSAIDVRLRSVPYLERPVRHNMTVTFHIGAAECEARLSLLDADSLPANESAWAQLRLAEPTVVLRGDRFIVRDPNGTLGGGIVVDTDARRHRRYHAATIASLEALAGGSPEDALLAAIERLQPVDLADAAETAALETDEARRVAEKMAASGSIVVVGNSVLYTTASFQALTRRLTQALAVYHHEFPLRRGMPREELRSRLGLKSGMSDGVTAALAERAVVEVRGDVVALPTHSVTLTPDQQRAADEYLALLRATPFSPPTDGAPAEDALALLLDRSDVVRVGEGVVFAADVYDGMVAQITERLRADGQLTLAEVRDMFGTSRRFAQALLEHLDARKITRRVGDARVLR